MAYCKNCGAELPEHAVFCSKCGIQNPVSAATEIKESSVPEQTVTKTDKAPVPQTNATTEKTTTGSGKPANMTWFKNNFMWLYVIIGVASYLLLQLGTVMIACGALGFGVMLCVLSIMAAIAFCVLGIIRFATADNRATIGRKFSNADIICFALGIMIFLYVFIMAIVVM